MNLDENECWARLARARSAALATVSQARGVDVVPVVFALDGGRLVIPIDTVKPKRHTRLARLENLRTDSRCCLLVDHYREDWSALWWVRVHARGEEAPLTSVQTAALAARYTRYAEPGALAGVLLLTPTSVAGWAA